MDEKTIVSTDGLVIKEHPLNEADKLVTVLTAEYGKISVLARGVKKINSKRASGLSILDFSTFEFEKNGERLVYKDSRIKTHFENIQLDLSAFSLASYICEVAGECSYEGNDDGELLRLCLNSLYAVDKGLKSVPFIKAVFEMKAACVLGFAPETSCCIISGKKLSETPGRMAFCATEGGFILEESFANSGELMGRCKSVTTQVFSAIKHIVNADQKRMLSFEIDPTSEIVLCEICEEYFLAKSEKKFRSLSYYKKNLGLV